MSAFTKASVEAAARKYARDTIGESSPDLEAAFDAGARFMFDWCEKYWAPRQPKGRR